jgi:uncharacterized GH25 family protein
MNQSKLTLVTLALLGVASPVLAHDTWLAPDKFKAAPGATVTLDMTSGMEFPKLDAGPKPERVETAKCRLSGDTFDLEQPAGAANSLQFKANLRQEGLATLWVKLKPRALELKPDEVQHYLDEVDASPALRREWHDMKEKRWRESYTKHTKTFVRVGEAPNDRSWAEPVGAGLEIVPEKDPMTIGAGEVLPVRVLKNGAPFSDFSINAVREGETKGETRRTDPAGRAAFRISGPGRLMIRGTEIRKSTLPDVEWESDFATLTLEVVAK